MERNPEAGRNTAIFLSYDIPKKIKPFYRERSNHLNTQTGLEFLSPCDKEEEVQGSGGSSCWSLRFPGLDRDLHASQTFSQEERMQGGDPQEPTDKMGRRILGTWPGRQLWESPVHHNPSSIEKQELLQFNQALLCPEPQA